MADKFTVLYITLLYHCHHNANPKCSAYHKNTCIFYIESHQRSAYHGLHLAQCKLMGKNQAGFLPGNVR